MVPADRVETHVPIQLHGGLQSLNRIVTPVGTTQHSVWLAVPQA
jgi:hypothetical protein